MIVTYFAVSVVLTNKSAGKEAKRFEYKNLLRKHNSAFTSYLGLTEASD